MQAFVFKKNQPSAIPADLTLSQHGLQVREEGEVHARLEQLPWSALSLEQGGAGNKLLFFHVENREDLSSVYLPLTAELLATLKTIDQPQVGSFLNRQKHFRLKQSALLTGVLSGFLAFVLAIYFLWSPLLGALTNFLPFSVEQKIGDRILGLILPISSRVDNPEVLGELRKQIEPLRLQLPKEMQDLRIYLSRDLSINAFALPGGNLVFNLGLLREAKKMEEILGVAGHELAHVRERHVLKALVQALGGYLIVDLLFGNITGIIAVLTSQSELLLSRGFSRSQERDADLKGMEMLAQAGIDPLAMADFFEIILAEAKKNEASELGQIEKHLGFLSTHPHTEERIESIKKWRADHYPDHIFSKIDMDFSGFQAKVKAL